jgi:hypothetical protein
LKPPPLFLVPEAVRGEGSGAAAVFGRASTSVGTGAVIVCGTPLPTAEGWDSALPSHRKIAAGLTIWCVIPHILPPLALRHIALGARAGQVDQVAGINDEDTGTAIPTGGHDAPFVGTPRRVNDTTLSPSAYLAALPLWDNPLKQNGPPLRGVVEQEVQIA